MLSNQPPHAAGYSNTKELGAVLYTEHVYAFELAAFMLLLVDRCGDYPDDAPPARPEGSGHWSAGCSAP